MDTPTSADAESQGRSARHGSCNTVTRPGPDFRLEEEYWRQGLRFVAGVDEAGRGSLAGPVVVAAVVLNPWTVIEGVNDSKRLSPGQRAQVYTRIRRVAVAIGVGAASPREIDALNVWRATCLAARRAVRRLHVPLQHVLMDGALLLPELHVAQTAVVDGDARCVSIASASIVAKVRRDRAMDLLELRHPGYGFDRHKGYGTAAHMARIRERGPGAFHRMSFAPLAQMELW